MTIAQSGQSGGHWWYWLPRLRSRQEKPGSFLQNGEHPLDAALEIARDGLRHIDANIHNYAATLIKRERVSGELLEYQSLDVKIRHRRTAGEKTVSPFSVYLRFVAPQSVAGREVIWVEGRNEGKLVAHDAGLKNLLRLRSTRPVSSPCWATAIPSRRSGYETWSKS